MIVEVIITRELVKAHPDYTNSEDCPLYHAFKEQHPEINLTSVGGYGGIRINKGDYIYPDGEWNGVTHKAMLGEAKYIERFTEEGEEVPEKVILKYNI